jgi:hypothetical protein
MHRKTLTVVVFAALALMRWTAPAAGQMMSCAGDREKFCSHTPPGGGRVVVCLRQHESELSEGCRHALGAAAPDAHAGGGGGAKSACRQDAMKFCRAAAGDQAKMKACMQAHAAELSDGCKTALIAQPK